MRCVTFSRASSEGKDLNGEAYIYICCQCVCVCGFRGYFLQRNVPQLMFDSSHGVSIVMKFYLQVVVDFIGTYSIETIIRK
jgi:hypothetical protein